MLSLDSFYKIISKNLLEPIECEGHFFKVFGSKNPLDLDCIWDQTHGIDSHKCLVFYDQEPIYKDEVQKIYHLPQPVGQNESWDMLYCIHTSVHESAKINYFSNKFYIFANSEISDEKNKILKDYFLLDWYYFFHGFAALDWYNNIQYLPHIKTYTKLFITFNNLINGNRNYRLVFLAQLIENNLQDLGHISLNQVDTTKKIKIELSDKKYLSAASKKLIYKNLLPTPPKFIIDHKITTGKLSANDELDTLSLGLFHIVTETIFYENKLHLTEKIFKPIVARRPFLLLAAAGNLKYLKKYGFLTFDKWIDESYDDEIDPDKRILKVVGEIKRLSNLPKTELDKLYEERQPTLEHNFKWFYKDFKKIIITELVDNFEILLKKYNLNKSKFSPDYLDYSVLNFEDIKKRLTLTCN